MSREAPARIRRELKQLATDTALAFLRELGVTGSDTELRQVIEGEFQGHALSLNLLGNYLREATSDHDIGRWHEASLLAQDTEEGGHASRVLQAYERWLGPQSREVAVLRLLGLFDRPADASSLDSVRRAPVIAGLTESLASLAEGQWNRTLTRLENLRLISRSPVPQSEVTSHPLLREHFAAQLQTQCPGAWREAHSRLYDHLRAATPDKPDTLEGLQPLYYAVAHGCLAGRHQEASDDVYWPRILRGEEYFSTRKLGAFGAELSTLAHFFDPPWSRPVPTLREEERGWFLNQAAFVLRAQGRLAEALEPMRTTLESNVTAKAWSYAARVAGNLSELHLALGQIDEATDRARQSVEHADLSGNALYPVVMRTILAEALHQAGQCEQAAALFAEAEHLQAQDQPQFPLLYSLRGYRYCDLLLADVEQFLMLRSSGIPLATAAPAALPDARAALTRCCEIRQRAEKTLEWAQQRLGLLDIALDHLTLGRTHALEACLTGSASQPATDHLDTALTGLRNAAAQEFISRGLLARASFRIAQAAWTAAETDLTAAETIATRSAMKLVQADTHLLRARIAIRVCDTPDARQHLNAARQLIDQTHYHRRNLDLQLLSSALPASATT